uniref:DUF547 domain-containing protein n=1 Tax=Glycine max TaxID=3847 RepID=A0A0R0FLR3_SOYBN
MLPSVDNPDSKTIGNKKERYGLLLQSFPMTLFQPRTVRLNHHSLKLLKYWTWQFVVVRPVCSVLMIALQLCGLYPTWLSWAFTIVLYISVSFALYSLVVFYHVFAKELAPHKPLAKFLCIKGIVFFCFWQMRELLGELVMVEGEIARLKSQISQLQDGLKREQEVTMESKPKTIFQERMAFETKALHFISKAIKGDYNLNDFSYNDKAGFFKTSVEQKESKFQDVKFQEKLPRKNGIVKPPSPMRDPRHPSPKITLDPLLSEENDLKWQPNKLSESIMNSMDPKFISSPSSIPLLRKLRILMSNLQTVDLKSLTNQQKLAFWINVYNACIMHGFIQYGVPSTPEKLLALMNKIYSKMIGNVMIDARSTGKYYHYVPAPVMGTGP